MLEVERERLIKVAMGFYLGERCKFCGKQYTHYADLRDAVYAGYHAGGRLACGICWLRYGMVANRWRVRYERCGA